MKLIALPGETVVHRLAFYLAMEEYVAKEMAGCGDCFFVWQSEPTVIVGRNQLIEAETDVDYCRSNGITLVRRKSGGGCVYSDMGNLMLSCITDGDNVGFVFDRYLRRIALALRKKGIAADVSGRNDITVGGRKVSGNAFQKLPGGRCIIHGTLLCGTDLERMQRVLTPSSAKLESNGVASVRKRVANLKELAGVTAGEMRRWMESEMCDSRMELTAADVGRIEEIEKTYADPGFLYGKNPSSTVTKVIKTPHSGELCFKAVLKNGTIRRVALSGDFFSTGDAAGELERALEGRAFDRESVGEALRCFEMEKYILNLTTNEFIESLFKL